MAVTISMVTMKKGAKISGGKIPTAWSARWPNSALPENGAKKENTLSYEVGEFHVTYALMPAPIPWSALEAACASNPLWPNAASELRQHATHVIVNVSGDGDVVEQLKILTHATIALTDSCDGATGVYWCHSLLVLSPELFTEIATSHLPDELPLPIWINACVVQDPDGTTAGLTRGLASFGQMEFETVKSPEPPDELRNRLLGLADYVIRKGAVIKDGDTIGESAQEKIKVNYKPSTLGLSGTVMRLDYPSSQSGGKRMTTYGKIHALATLLCTIGFGYVLYAFLPLLRGSLLRHFLFIPLILVFGFVLLLTSDRFLQKTFGWEAFDERKT